MLRTRQHSPWRLRYILEDVPWDGLEVRKLLDSSHLRDEELMIKAAERNHSKSACHHNNSNTVGTKAKGQQLQ